MEYMKNIVKHNFLLWAVGCSILFVARIDSVNCQEFSRSEIMAREDSLRKLYVTFKKKNNIRVMLQRILTSLYTLDSTYLAHCPVWVIRDEDIKHRTFRMFRNNQLYPSRQSNVVVVTDPEKKDILLLWMGEAMLNTREARFMISDSLKQAILTTRHAYKISEGMLEKRERTISFEEKPKRVTVDMSLFSGSLRYGNGWGLQVAMGKDEIGYPFWYTGQADFMIIIHQLKLGVSIPYGFGLVGIEGVGPVSLQPRKLDGAPGMVTQFNHLFGDFNFKARFYIGELTKVHARGNLVDPMNVYFVNSIGQLSLSRSFEYRGGGHVFTYTGGLGYHKIGCGILDTLDNVSTFDKITFFSPLVKTELIFHGVETFGVEVQYYSNIISVGAWLELLKNFVYIEGKYSLPIIRSPKPWERSYFVMISPRFRFVF